MFDNMSITKAYKILDNINNNLVEVCTFNAMLNSTGGVHMNMNINYPNLYMAEKDKILVAYRKFSSDVTALAVNMGLATTIEETPSILDNLASLKEEMTKITNEVFNQVLATLGDITVNPVPIVDVGTNNNTTYPSSQPYPGTSNTFSNPMR